MNKDLWELDNKVRKKLCMRFKENLGEIREIIKKLSELDSYGDLKNLSEALHIMSNDASFEAISIERSCRNSIYLNRRSLKEEHSITGNAFLY